MNEPIDDCRCGHLIGKDLRPFFERQVRRQRDAASFVTLRAEREEQIGCFSFEGYISKLIDKQQIDAVEFAEVQPREGSPIRLGIDKGKGFIHCALVTIGSRERLFRPLHYARVERAKRLPGIWRVSREPDIAISEYDFSSKVSALEISREGTFNVM